MIFGKFRSFIPPRNDFLIVLTYQNLKSNIGDETYVLEQIEAEMRKELVSDVFYNLILVLPPGGQYYGKGQINFIYLPKHEHEALEDQIETNDELDNLFLDFDFNFIECIKINGVLVNPEDIVRNHRIYLSHKMIVSGSNVIEVSYLNNYRVTGTGLHKFVDPVDNREYLYSQFAVFHANKTFPGFDQPDIKARMHLTTVCSPEDVSISNSKESCEYNFKTHHEKGNSFVDEHKLESGVSLFEDDYKITYFTSDLLMSTYLFSIIGGPYHIVEKSAEFDHISEPIRMRFICRQSLKMHAFKVYDDMYEAVVTGIKWYSKFFGFDYPWDKYDQIFGPEFKYGAMENVGSVTLSENYIPHDKFTEIQLTDLQNTVLHELCHMWFGNLCTMKWWDDLWLNEAFATYMSYLCTDQNENLRIKTPGLWIFLNKRKSMAVTSDGLSTTHPIIKDTPNTDSADDLLNSITYGKGSGFIKQLVHIIGLESMSKTGQLYFKKHAWGNTTLDDFLGALSKGGESNEELGKLDIQKFGHDFLTTQGVNTVRLRAKSRDDGIELSLKQYKGFYSDSINIQKCDFLILETKDKIDELVDDDSDEDLLTHYNFEISKQSIFLNNNGDTQIAFIPGKNLENTYIIANANDQAYMQFILNKCLIEGLSKGLIGKIPDSINRIIIWRSLISMVSKLLIKSTVFFKIILENIGEEDDIILLDSLFPTFEACINGYIPNELYNEECRLIFNKLYKTVIKLPKEKEELRSVFKTAMFNYLVNDEHLKMVTEWLENKGIVLKNGDKREDLKIKTSDRYKILEKIFEGPNIDLSVKQKLLQIELDNCSNDRAKRLAIEGDALLPDLENKEKIWEIITQPLEHNISCYDYSSYIEGFFGYTQSGLLKPYLDKYIEQLEVFADYPEKEYMSIFVSDLCPRSPYVTNDFLNNLKRVCDKFEAEDSVKYDSFLRLLKGRYEGLSGYERIKEHVLVDSGSESE